MLRILFIALLAILAPTSAAAGNGGVPAVAVLYFDNNSGDAELDVLSKGFADMLITDLSSTGAVTVVEREKLQALLQEVKIQRNKFFDRKTAVKLGKGLGARYVLSGSFMQVKPQMRIDIRMIEVATSKVMLATQVKGATKDVFALEQKLVADFMAKLNHKFLAQRLPSTKVPNLEALLSYSEGLALVDKGEAAKAAAMMKALASTAPTFGLARSRHAQLVKILAASSIHRGAEREADTKKLFAEAKAFVAGHKVADLGKEDGRHYLAYRALLGLEIVSAMHKALVGYNVRGRAVPRKNSARAVGLMKAYYSHLRTFLIESRTLSSRITLSSIRLPDAAAKRARDLDLDIRTSFPAEKILDFLFLGRAPKVGKMESFIIHPPLANIDPKMKKAALAVVAAELARVSPSAGPSLDAHQARVLKTLATWHIDSGRVEAGVIELQRILDRFPNIHNWSRIEGALQQQLGLKSSHSVGQRVKYEQGLVACEWWPYHVGLSGVFSRRLHAGGLGVIPIMEKELTTTCSKSADYKKMQKSLYQDAFLAAARFSDCEWFELYLKKWLAVGGSALDGSGYRKNYSTCR